MKHVLAVLMLMFATTARAHFKLMAPESWSAQNLFGDPQKSAPCGQADPGNAVEPSGQVKVLREGSVLTVTIDETIFHPGHYRISLAANQASLPPDPAVTPGSSACGSTSIEMNPTLPLLADGQLIHTAAFGEPKSIQIQLPAGLTCTNCVLQVAEFMSNHGLNNPGGCFYHHCANVTIEAADAGTLAADGGAKVDTVESPGCGCITAVDMRIGVAALAGFWLLRKRNHNVQGLI